MTDPDQPSVLTLPEMLTVLKAGAEETRLRILHLLSLGELSIKDLTVILGQSQPRVSRHIRLLADAGLLRRHREATWVFCRLTDDGVASALIRSILSQIDNADALLAADRERLEMLKSRRTKASENFFNAIAGQWDQVRSLQIGEAQVERTIKKLTAKHRFRTMLDFGTGTARMLELLADRIERGVGIDVSHTMLAHARAKLEAAGLSNCQVRHGDITSLSQDAASADLVVIHHVLHYFDDPLPVLREAARVLGGGGKLVIVDFAPHALEFLRFEHAHRRLGFSHEQMSTWLEAAGFSPRDVVDLARTGGANDKRLTVTVWLAARNGTAANGNADIGVAA